MLRIIPGSNRAIGHFRVPLCLCFKASLSEKLILCKWLNLHENGTACRTHFHMKGFALRLVLKQRPRGPCVFVSKLSLSAKPFIWQYVRSACRFSFHANQTHFNMKSMKDFEQRSRFETEEQGNLWTFLKDLKDFETTEQGIWTLLKGLN